MQTQTGTAASLLELLSTFPSLRTRGLLRQILGITERTLKSEIAKDLSVTLTLGQTKRAQGVSEILFQATKVLGSAAAADAWMTRRAIGLGSEMPLEMMKTPEGCLALRDHLVRMEYGVYC